MFELGLGGHHFEVLLSTLVMNQQRANAGDSEVYSFVFQIYYISK
jgi:hypothetical protein